jgi:hypothetical protein
MAKKYRRAGKRTKARLTEQVEQVEQTPSSKPSGKSTDSFDPEIGTYIEAFLQGLPEAVQLETFSIATPDEAKKALSIIDETMQRLNQQLANARALQRLVISTSSTDS